MAILLYIIGYALIIGGISWALVAAGIKATYIIITVMILAGMAILRGVTHKE